MSSDSCSLFSLESAVSEPMSQKHKMDLEKETDSLYIYMNLRSTGEFTNSSQDLLESDLSEATVYEEEDIYNSKDDILLDEKFHFKTHPLIDPDGWIKCASDKDPWNSENYSPVRILTDCNGVLTHEMIFEFSSKIGQLPHCKSFALLRLHINQKGLKDISVLESYNHFQYIDASWNSLTDLQALSNCTYLMYLNASHNKVTAVLDFKPPWFLTHVNLENNEIKNIGLNLSNFWSLRYLDLSFNLIEKIEDLGNLKYLRHLNLSNNKIKTIENLECIHLVELNLERNEIAECNMDRNGLHALKNIKSLKLAHNKLSSLVPFQGLFSLRMLDISHNFVTELSEVDNLKRLSNLYELNVTNNPVCSSIGYREFVIYALTNLRMLDSVSINSSERVAANMLLEPDIFTTAQHLRTKLELWNQVASQEINIYTVPCDEVPVPLVILVGSFMNGKEVIAKTLVLKYQMYRCKKYTTLPLNMNYEPENLISVHIDEFNTMIKKGKFILLYKEIGYFFGVCQNEISTCIEEGKIGIIDTILEAALLLKCSQLYPFLFLSITEDIESYSNKLLNTFMDMDLWNKYHPPELKEAYSVTDEEEFEDYGEDEFIWTWSMESSKASLQSEPDYTQLNLIMGTETFVRKILHQQETYVEMHNIQPGLFYDTVLTDNVDKAVYKIGKTCYKILKNKVNMKTVKDLLEESQYASFVQDRVDCLLKDFIKVLF